MTLLSVCEKRSLLRFRTVLIITCVALITFGILAIYFQLYNTGTNEAMEEANAKSLIIEEATYPEADLLKLAENVQVETHKIHVENSDVFYRKGSPPKDSVSSHQTLLLLHGMSFKSQTWLDLKTIHLLAAMGHTVYAVDLPGYGETGGEQIPQNNKGQFLDNLMKALNLKKPIIVSPSMSGSFALPLLLTDSSKFGGYIPIAPVGTEKYKPDDYKKVQVPTLIIYGEKDVRLGAQSTQFLSNIPNSEISMFPGAGHAAYLDQPKLFHQLLYSFLKKLDSAQN